jgi:hypothetical protein
MQDLIVNEVFVNYESKDVAKNMGCKWDSLKSRWYVPNSLYIQDVEVYNDFRALALVDRNDIISYDMKLLGCKFLGKYKKWIISKSIYEKRKTEFDLYKLEILTEIVNEYNYIPPPSLSKEEQLSQLIKIMSPDFIED